MKWKLRLESLLDGMNRKNETRRKRWRKKRNETRWWCCYRNELWIFLVRFLKKNGKDSFLFTAIEMRSVCGSFSSSFLPLFFFSIISSLFLSLSFLHLIFFPIFHLSLPPPSRTHLSSSVLKGWGWIRMGEVENEKEEEVWDREERWWMKGVKVLNLFNLIKRRCHVCKGEREEREKRERFQIFKLDQKCSSKNLGSQLLAQLYRVSSFDFEMWLSLPRHDQLRTLQCP